MIDEFLLRPGRIFGVTDVDNIQHFVTCLSSDKDKKTGKGQQYIQQHHRDFQPSELDTANNNWQAAFIPMAEYGMQTKVLHNKKEAVFNIPYKQGDLMNIETVHAGGYCDEENEGNLRMQINFSIDSTSAPLPTIIKQEHVIENSCVKDIR